MDSHYHQVMKMREQVSQKLRDENKEKDQRFYFGYSGILDRIAFEQWRSEHSYEFFQLPEGQVAEASDMDLIFDFPSRWWGGRVAGLVPKSGSSVFGRLFEIPAVDWPVVQHKEGVITGMSVEREITVKVGPQKSQAIAFTTHPERARLEGPVSERFLEALLRGAQQASLPQNYINSIKSKAI